MCHGIQRAYPHCGHERPLEITHPCPLFSPSAPCPLQTITPKPPLAEPPHCTPCARRIERNIIKEYEIQNPHFETRVQELTRQMRAEMDGERRREMGRERSALVEAMGDLKDRRNEEVAEFRFRQGGRG